MHKEPENCDDIIDSRDVIARIEELRDERDDCGGAEAREDWEAQNGGELRALESLASEGEGAPGWSHGEALIRDSYFADYAEQLADDIGAIDRNARWPVNCIDWEKAASELKVDYFSVDFDGVTYWIHG